MPHLEPVHLERRDILFRAHETLRFAYFPTTAVVSLFMRLESGEMLEVGTIGRDGVAGAALLADDAEMACDGSVLIPGLALRVRTDELRQAARRDDTLHSLIGRHAQLILARTMQISVCNAFHSVEQRCIRLLLTINDLVSHAEIPLTHDLLASMLGVRRPTVTLVLGSLHRSGLLDEERGRILIRERRGLELACCECYQAMCDQQQRLLGYRCHDLAPAIGA
jgi:CRP-like cAMP-binding protein